MVSKVLQRLRCVIGRHQRSRARAREVDGTIVSVCRGCGRPMVKDRTGWRMGTVR